MQPPTRLEILLADVGRRGITLRTDGERLRYTAPPGALTPDIVAELRAHKSELIAMLQQRPREPERTYPASFAQRRFWTLQQLNPAEAFYNVPFVFRLSGPLDVSILRHSFHLIVCRHDTLRTTLQQRDGELMQVVAPTGEISLDFRDLRDCSAPTRAETVTGLLQAGLVRPFDLASETGLRVLLLQTGSAEFLMQLCFHNTLFDQSSLLVLLKELSMHYTGLLSGALRECLRRRNMPIMYGGKNRPRPRKSKSAGSTGVNGLAAANRQSGHGSVLNPRGRALGFGRM